MTHAGLRIAVKLPSWIRPVTRAYTQFIKAKSRVFPINEKAQVAFLVAFVARRRLSALAPAKARLEEPAPPSALPEPEQPRPGGFVERERKRREIKKITGPAEPFDRGKPRRRPVR
jgi:hypothetical protein